MFIIAEESRGGYTGGCFRECRNCHQDCEEGELHLGLEMFKTSSMGWLSMLIIEPAQHSSETDPPPLAQCPTCEAEAWYKWRRRKLRKIVDLNVTHIAMQRYESAEDRFRRLQLHGRGL